MTEVSLAETSPADWALVAEGGANLVARYTGTLPRWKRKVIRLRKRPLADGGAASPTDAEDPAVAFVEAVVDAVLLPDGLTASLSSLRAPPGFLAALVDRLEPSRAAKRRKVDTLDAARELVAVSEDLTGPFSDRYAPESTVVTVEIKPKWGFLPSPTYLSRESRPIKTRFCRFCMHQHLRASDPKHKPTRYCPLDLYSGQQERIERALNALYAHWHSSEGGGNQLRIFVNSRMLHPSEESILLDALGRSDAFAAVDATKTYTTRFATLVGTAFASDPMLARLQHVQRTLDSLDVEGLDALARVETGASLLDGAADAILPPSATEQAALARHLLDNDDSRPLSFRDAAVAYALSAAVKDCSLLVRIMVDEPGLPCDFKAVDVDPKALDRLRRYAALDTEIWQAARTLVKEPCVDANAKARGGSR